MFMTESTGLLIFTANETLSTRIVFHLDLKFFFFSDGFSKSIHSNPSCKEGFRFLRAFTPARYDLLDRCRLKKKILFSYIVPVFCCCEFFYFCIMAKHINNSSIFIIDKNFTKFNVYIP